MKSWFIKSPLVKIAILAVMLSLLAACGAAQPETITIIETVVVKEEVVVEKEVIVEKEVEVEVEKEVVVEKEVEVEVEVVITATPEPSSGQIIYGLYQEPQILNVFIATQTAAGEALTPVVEGLLGIDPDGNFYPQLAQELPTIANGQVSEDGLNVTYHLKEGVLWSDGAPFSCDDVLFTWETVVHPDSGAVSTTGYDKIESIECPDDTTVEITFSEFFAPYLSLFSTVEGVMPRHATGPPEEMQKWVYNWHPVGTGPFKIQEWVSGDHITYVPNENYRDYPAKPGIDKLVIRIIPSREVGKALIRTGEIDILWDLTEADIPEFEDIPAVVVNNRPGAGTERLVLNLADPELDAPDNPLDNPHWALGDLRVRQAIQAAIDKNFINEQLLFGLAKPGTNELNNGWAQVELPESAYDVGQAEALLEEAGWTDADGDGVRECNGCLYAEAGRPLTLKIQTTTGNKLREEAEQVLLEMMAEVGIEFFIENIPSSVLFGSWASDAFRKHGQFDILMYTTSDSVDPQSQVKGYFHMDSMPTEANTGSGFNYSRWVNEEFSALVDAAGATPDLEERKDLYHQAMEILSQELPHIYLYDRGEIHLTRDHVENFGVNPWDNQTWNVAEWTVKPN